MVTTHLDAEAPLVAWAIEDGNTGVERYEHEAIRSTSIMDLTSTDDVQAMDSDEEE